MMAFKTMAIHATLVLAAAVLFAEGAVAQGEGAAINPLATATAETKALAASTVAKREDKKDDETDDLDVGGHRCGGKEKKVCATGFKCRPPLLGGAKSEYGVCVRAKRPTYDDGDYDDGYSGDSEKPASYSKAAPVYGDTDDDTYSAPYEHGYGHSKDKSASYNGIEYGDSYGKDKYAYGGEYENDSGDHSSDYGSTSSRSSSSSSSCSSSSGSSSSGSSSCSSESDSDSCSSSDDGGREHGSRKHRRGRSHGSRRRRREHKPVYATYADASAKSTKSSKSAAWKDTAKKALLADDAAARDDMDVDPVTAAKLTTPLKPAKPELKDSKENSTVAVDDAVDENLDTTVKGDDAASDPIKKDAEASPTTSPASATGRTKTASTKSPKPLVLARRAVLADVDAEIVRVKTPRPRLRR